MLSEHEAYAITREASEQHPELIILWEPVFHRWPEGFVTICGWHIHLNRPYPGAQLLIFDEGDWINRYEQGLPRPENMHADVLLPMS